MLKRAAAILHVSGIELVGTWDIRPDNVSEMRKALTDYGLACVSIIPEMLAYKIYWKGSYCSSDPKVRCHALDYTHRMCDIARELGCSTLNLWPGQDGYDYLLCGDYEKERAWLCDAIAELAGDCPDWKFPLEYKPKEPRAHSYMARMADTLLLAQETGHSNVGVTIDTGHGFVGGGVVGEAILLAKRAGGRLFHMHFNDNRLTTHDDMIVGTVHSVCYLEMLYWLDRCGYDGWLSMDQYPYCEDVIRVIRRYQVLHPLAYLLERTVGSGRLILCALQLDENSPEARYLVNVIGRYARQSNKPQYPEIRDEQLERLREALALA